MLSIFLISPLMLRISIGFCLYLAILSSSFTFLINYSIFTAFLPFLPSSLNVQ